jgi:hypothetical protein
MLYVLTFGGDQLTLDALDGSERDHAKAELDAWWMRSRRAGQIAPWRWRCVTGWIMHMRRATQPSAR